jgi:FecR-like protein
MSNELQLGPPPVEPLSDVAWARVERGLFARMDTGAQPVVAAPPTRRWLWIAAPMLAAAAAVALWIGLRSPVAPPHAVGPDPLIIVPGESPSTVSAGDAFVTLEAHSKVVLSREAPTALVEHGAAWFQVAPRHEQPPYVVVAGDTVVRVIGTRFKVGRYAEVTTVAVERGLVDVRFRGVGAQVGAGQTWSSNQPNAISATTRTASAAEPAPVKPAPVAASAPTTDETEMAPVRARPRAKPVTPPTPGTSQAAPVVDPDQTKFNEATALERRDPKAALTAYMELSQGNGKWAANALYAAGRLAKDLGDPRAETFLRIYLRRFPKGKNVDDARKLLEGEHR